MFATIALLLPILTTPAATQDQGLTLHESSSGATITLPADWSLAKDDEVLMAHGEDKKGFVMLIGVEENFDQVREDVKELILSRLDDVVVVSATAEGVDERGHIEEIVVASGKGKSKLDGAEVDFAGLLVRSEGTGALVLGAWKDDANKALVAGILDSLHVKDSAGKEGLVITNAKTGASVTIPAGWEIMRSRKGLIAAEPKGKAMAVLMNWQGDFQKSLEKMRATMLLLVFKEVEIGEFAVVEASYDKSLGRVVAASGKAIDREDDMPVAFTALRIQQVDTDHGAVLFGAWKDEKHEKLIAELMASIEIKKPEKMKK